MARINAHETEDSQGMRTGLVQMLFTVVLFAGVIVFLMLLVTRIFPALYNHIVNLI